MANQEGISTQGVSHAVLKHHSLPKSINDDDNTVTAATFSGGSAFLHYAKSYLFQGLVGWLSW